MRIVEPGSFNVSKKTSNVKRHKSRKIYFLPVMLLLILVTIGYALFILGNDTNPSDKVLNDTVVLTEPNNDTPEVPQTGLIIFEGNELRLLYDNLVLPNTNKINVPPAITGDDIADARIRQLAELRGYKLRSVAATTLPTIDGQPLQQVMHQPWEEMQAAAAQNGLNMTIVSAFRSVSDQRELFLSRLKAEGISETDVAAGVADAEINKVLITTSVPGYSKHHSGYTIDLYCAGWEFENFKNSPCNDWLIANNYENAKLYGFIPSYPLDADLQGPDPEAWEYVYVGSELLNW